MMAKRVNKKKTMSICPTNVVRSKCPSIRKTRQLRRELLMKQRVKGVTDESLDVLRKNLRTKKTKGIKIDCKGCRYNNAKAPVEVAS